MRGATELHVGGVERGHLRGAQPGLDREQQEGVVASAGPGGAVRRAKERIDLVVVEECHERAIGAFGRDRQHALDVVDVLGVSERGVAVERVDRREPCVAGSGAVAAFGLEVIEERGNSVGVEIGDVEHRWLPAAAGRGESQHQLDRVAVGGDRVRAGVALLDEPLGEERLDGRSERAHDRVSCAVSSRWPAIAISSGAADKYQ
jgi:hypothetical protein